MKLLIFGGSLAIILLSTQVSRAQSNVGSNADGFLVRIEHLLEHSDACMLINQDGAYRLERIFSGKTEVSAGALSQDKLLELRALLDAPDLQQLTQDKIGRPLVVVDQDELSLNIKRRELQQELIFADAKSRLRFRPAVDPILKWFNEAQELRGATLSEDSASRCMPPPRRRLSTISSTSNWLVQFSTDEIFVGRVERVCLIVYSSGEYQREKERQIPGSSQKGSVYGGHLTDSQLGDLRKLLDDSELAKMPSGERGFVFRFSEGRFTTVKIPRSDRLQTLFSSSYYKVAHEPREAGGLAGVHTQIANVNEAIRPLQNWLQRNVLQAKSDEHREIAADGCRPHS